MVGVLMSIGVMTVGGMSVGEITDLLLNTLFVNYSISLYGSLPIQANGKE
jgi:hypothetical protein